MKMVASVLLLLALLALLAIHRHGLTDQAAERGERAVVRVKDVAIYNEHRFAAVLTLMAIFAFVIWTALRANQGENKAMPPARESSSRNKTALR